MPVDARIPTLRDIGRRGALLLLSVAGIGLVWSGLTRRPGSGLPVDVIRKIEEEHVTCIGVDHVPYWPGDYRQAECGTVEVEVLAQGVIPDAEQQAGVTRAVCYRQMIASPYWEVQRQTRHEILIQTRSSYKVALQQAGVWVIFLDEDVADRERWDLYACPQPVE